MGIRSIMALFATTAAVTALAACSSDSTVKPGPDAQVTPHADAAPPDEPACGSKEAPTCPAEAPSYKTEIAPILEARCNYCHVGGPTGPWPLTPYEDLSHWKDLLMKSMLECTMPPEDAGNALSPAERAKVIAWLACKAPNN